MTFYGVITLANKNTPPLNVEPMPCRGCTESCKNRPFCNGRPWRQKAEAIAPANTSFWGKIAKIFH